MSFYLQSLLIFSSFLFVFIWENSQLKVMTIPAIGFLIFMFLLISMKNKRNMNLGGPYNFFILNTVLLLFIFQTGGISSALFFILYFLLFGASFIMDPRVVFMFPVGILVIFWPQVLQNDTVSNIIKIVSLFLLSPLAYFFGVQFRKTDKASDEVIKTKEREQEAAQNITEDVEDIIEDNKEKLSPEDLKKLNEILEETDDLRNEK